MLNSVNNNAKYYKNCSKNITHRKRLKTNDASLNYNNEREVTFL